MADTNIPEGGLEEILESSELSSTQIEELLYRFEHMNLLASIYDVLLVLLAAIEGNSKTVNQLIEMHKEGQHYYPPPAEPNEAGPDS